MPVVATPCPPVNEYSVPGMMIRAWAKMIGMTPAELIRIGMNDLVPSRTRPRPTTFRGICTGILRAAIVSATTAAVIAISTTTSSASLNRLIPPACQSSMVLNTAAGKPCRIEKKIRSDMPLPIPRSVICSPSHITNTPPAVRSSTVTIRKLQPGATTTPGWDSRKIEYPYACMMQRNTVE